MQRFPSTEALSNTSNAAADPLVRPAAGQLPAAKIASSARISEIDISGPARALSILRLSDYVLVVVCGGAALSAVASLFAAESGADIVVGALMIAALVFAAYTGWRHVGVIDPRVWRAYLWVFPLLMLFAAMMMLAAWSAYSSAPDGGDAAVFALITQATNALVFAGVAIPSFVCVLMLRKVRIAPTRTPLRDLLEDLEKRGGSSAVSTAKLPRANAPRGIAFVVVGAILLLGVIVVPLPSDPHTASNAARMSEYVMLLGFFLLVRGRRYFQVSADALLAVDHRPPILFLRSFEDDEKQRFSDARRALLDFSLETRLANHFMHFGPFIAIGSPKESVPQLGAARVLLSDEDWQGRVVQWMKSAQLIIMYSGKTQWVNWELRKILDSARATSLILMFPESRAWRRSKRDADVAARVEHIRAVFADTPWSSDLAAYNDFTGLRSMLFFADGSMLMVRSRSRSRDAYHLSALIAHRHLLDAPAEPDIAKAA